MNEKIRVLHRVEVINAILDISYNAEHRIDICGNSRFPSLIFSFESIRKAIMNAKNRKYTRRRYIFEITQENIHYCKDLMKIAEMRHMNENEANNFLLNENEYLGSITLKEPHQQAIYTNIREIVEQQQNIFETLWNRSILAEKRIKDIEEGIESASIEIIASPTGSIKRAYDLIKSAEEEVLRIFSSIHAFRRQTRLGIMHLFKDAVERGVRVRILIPADKNEVIQIVNEVNLVLPKLDIGSVDKSLESTVGILVVDRKESLIIETKDDSKDNSYDAARLAAYSNSKPIALAYASIFDSLWKQTELHQKLSNMYEQLKKHGKMQKEFIDIAAHELRTPIQPILGLTSILRSNNSRDRRSAAQNELLDVIMRNAKRLQRLADDILDVTKIESESLNLNKEFFNLNDVIANTIEDIEANIVKKGQEGDLIKLVYQPRDIFIEADKARISQVVSNILSNAVKFTETKVDEEEKRNGIINIKAEDVDGQALVSITDTGKGLDPEIMPRLFEKFASKSFSGTGLGLYICKSIVEAHGGKIWAENNNIHGERGATFTFTLPSTRSKQHQQQNYNHD